MWFGTIRTMVKPMRYQWRAGAWWWGLVVAACLWGCQREPAPEVHADDVVRSYFAAMKRRDCAAVKRVITGELAIQLAKQGCDEAFDTFEEHGIKLLRVDKVRRDGRAANTRLVTVVLRQSGKQKRVIVAVRGIGSRLFVSRL